MVTQLKELVASQQMLLKRQQSLNDALVADLDKMRTEVGSLRSQLEAVRAAQTSVDVLVEVRPAAHRAARRGSRTRARTHVCHICSALSHGTIAIRSGHREPHRTAQAAHRPL
eukprot:2744525-Prymnesium_polylepis.1